MTKRSTGRYERIVIGGEKIAAFVPVSLPPKKPPLVIEGNLANRLRQTEKALARRPENRLTLKTGGEQLHLPLYLSISLRC